MKYFVSFEELDRELDIRKTEVAISRRKLELHTSALKELITPNNFLLKMGFRVANHFVMGRLLKRILPFM